MYRSKSGLTAILAVTMFTIVLFSSLSTVYPKVGIAFAQANNPLQTTLAQIALADLKAEYDTMVSGNAPVQQMVTQFDGTSNQEITSAQRGTSAQNRANNFATSPMRYTSSNTSLTTAGIRNDATHILLDATENTTLYFANYYPNDPSVPKQTEMVIPHTFVFSNTAGGYQLIYDSTGCDPYGYYLCPPTDASTEASLPTNDAGIIFNRGPLPQPAVVSLNPVDNSAESTRTTAATSSCNYDGVAASNYAYFYAYSRNSHFRRFGNDCTNFVSQAVFTGGWKLKNCCSNHTSWDRWWYDIYGSQSSWQTRTWTQAKALEWFVPNSGRGHYTRTASDLSQGDLIFADWENDGQIDHAMIITWHGCLGGCNNWDQILVSYHTNDTRNRSLADIFGHLPNARFYPYWICGTR